MQDSTETTEGMSGCRREKQVLQKLLDLHGSSNDHEGAYNTQVLEKRKKISVGKNSRHKNLQAGEYVGDVGAT